MTTRIAVLVSGGGTNLQALLDAQAKGELGGGEISLVLSSNPNAYALERAKAANIPVAVVPRKGMTSEDFDKALLAELEKWDVGLLVLAGFLCVLGPPTIERYRRRILNIHPALIPAFSGVGMYGIKVHQKALEAGVKVTGATVHFVSDVVDGGEIVLQKAVNVFPGDTPEVLQRRVMVQAEQILLPKAVAMFCKGELG